MTNTNRRTCNWSNKYRAEVPPCSNTGFYETSEGLKCDEHRPIDDMFCSDCDSTNLYTCVCDHRTSALISALLHQILLEIDGELWRRTPESVHRMEFSFIYERIAQNMMENPQSEFWGPDFDLTVWSYETADNLMPVYYEGQWELMDKCRLWASNEIEERAQDYSDPQMGADLFGNVQRFIVTAYIMACEAILEYLHEEVGE